ncbi:cell wall-active antibiotics response protein LiaF [Alkaliphilus serpentinus]|uniref:Cell wall-active antibiotics response protein n=1 Tax=Alkaliphilus serpentinus TaxID=1482731 RepID=A0A833HNV1_9FIRM|nr:cell wall-active antibiotics response protein LiaF [Alkaliphilus serpentinus]KAB3530054.1 hypothetical protein F8153_08150 [Alkaliphilus serpentinus]
MKKNFWGILLVALGVLFLLSNAGIMAYDMGEIVYTYWPLIFVIWGLSSIINKITSRKYGFRLTDLVFPLFLIAGGLILTGNRLDMFGRTISFWQVFWPFVLIYIGLSFFTSHSFVYINDIKYDGKHKAKDNYKHNPNGFSEGKRHISIGSLDIGNEPWVLEDTNYHVGIGETTIDLSKAFLKEGETNMQITGHIGSITVEIPSDMAINVVANLSLGNISIFGNDHAVNPRTVTYRSEFYDEADKKLILYLSLKIGEIELEKVC